LKTAIITFIGAGNMASSIIGGLLASGHDATCLRASDPAQENLERLRQLGDIKVYQDNAAACAGADVVVMAIKPQIMATALADISAQVATSGSLVISIAAGTTIAAMQSLLKRPVPLVRCMPNTPALLGAGATALYASPEAGLKQRELAGAILGAVGLIQWVPQESDLDAITALSGSGPAYFFLFMEAMIEAACTMGLSRDCAVAMTRQTAFGAARMALESDVDLRELRRRVTSPGGTTERAVQCFEHEGLRDLVAHAMAAARERAEEMGAPQETPDA
jgi:pyrroline-5-carboxylate reductase